jgi:hypothetical protein
MVCSRHQHCGCPRGEEVIALSNRQARNDRRKGGTIIEYSLSLPALLYCVKHTLYIITQDQTLVGHIEIAAPPSMVWNIMTAFLTSYSATSNLSIEPPSPSDEGGAGDCCKEVEAGAHLLLGMSRLVSKEIKASSSPTETINRNDSLRGVVEVGGSSLTMKPLWWNTVQGRQQQHYYGGSNNENRYPPGSHHHYQECDDWDRYRSVSPDATCLSPSSISTSTSLSLSSEEVAADGSPKFRSATFLSLPTPPLMAQETNRAPIGGSPQSQQQQQEQNLHCLLPPPLPHPSSDVRYDHHHAGPDNNKWIHFASYSTIKHRVERQRNNDNEEPACWEVTTMLRHQDPHRRPSNNIIRYPVRQRLPPPPTAPTIAYSTNDAGTPPPLSVFGCRDQRRPSILPFKKRGHGSTSSLTTVGPSSSPSSSVNISEVGAATDRSANDAQLLLEDNDDDISSTMSDPHSIDVVEVYGSSCPTPSPTSTRHVMHRSTPSSSEGTTPSSPTTISIVGVGNNINKHKFSWKAYPGKHEVGCNKRLGGYFMTLSIYVQLIR